MPTQKHPPSPARYIGLDIHKKYLVAIGVDDDRNLVFGPQRVPWSHFENWVVKRLRHDDAVALEATTNAWRVHDALVEQVQSVTVVHPPSVRLIIAQPVKTDKKAARALADLLAAGLLKGIWVPPQPVRDLRALVSRRFRAVSMSTAAKNRLHSVLHRANAGLPDEGSPFAPENRDWWDGLPLSLVERTLVREDLDTLDFAQGQKERLEAAMHELAASDPRVPLLIQVPGIGVINAMTILGAVGDITRFENPEGLSSYAGLTPRIYDSGERRTTGKITKHGRRDLRRAMVDAANHAVTSHPRWQREFERLEPRKGRSKAVVAVARMMLVSVWHILSGEHADREIAPQQAASALFKYAYDVGVRNLPGGISARQFVRRELDRIGFTGFERFRWGSKWITLPDELRELEVNM